MSITDFSPDDDPDCDPPANTRKHPTPHGHHGHGDELRAEVWLLFRHFIMVTVALVFLAIGTLIIPFVAFHAVKSAETCGVPEWIPQIKVRFGYVDDIDIYFVIVVYAISAATTGIILLKNLFIICVGGKPRQ